MEALPDAREGHRDARCVAELARPHLWAVGPDEPLDAVAQQMVARRLSWAPVVERGTLLGVVSAWDLLHARSRGDPGDTPAWRVCTYKPLTVAPETSVAEAARLMRGAHVHHLLVVGAGQKIVGVVSPLDLLADEAAGA